MSAGSTTAAGGRATGILCGSWNDPHITSSFQAVGVVIGARNLSSSSSRSRRSTSKLTHNEKGSVFWHNGGMNRARASFQNELWTKVPSHHWRHRSSVRRSIVQCFSRSDRTRSASDREPWPRPARRPSPHKPAAPESAPTVGSAVAGNPLLAQQKLKRQSHCGPPRGLRS